MQALHSRQGIPLISPRLAAVCLGSCGRVGREANFSLGTSGFMSICNGTHLCLFPEGQHGHVREAWQAPPTWLFFSFPQSFVPKLSIWLVSIGTFFPNSVPLFNL